MGERGLLVSFFIFLSYNEVEKTSILLVLSVASLSFLLGVLPCFCMHACGLMEHDKDGIVAENEQQFYVSFDVFFLQKIKIK